MYLTPAQIKGKINSLANYIFAEALPKKAMY